MNKCVVSERKALEKEKRRSSLGSLSCTVASSGISCGTGGKFSKVMSVFSHQAYH